MLLQRYTFWSNSQLVFLVFASTLCCLCYCKDTLFEAIHNRLLWRKSLPSVVCVTAKIHFLKQFTTCSFICQNVICCLCYCKDTLFEAIHNMWNEYKRRSKLFVLLQRYTFWSNSQQPLMCLPLHLVVCVTAKIHFLKQFTT